MSIHHRRHVAPLARHFEVRHVTDPGLVCIAQRHVSQRIGHAGEELALPHLGTPVQPGAAPLQARLAHQTRHPTAPHLNALLLELLRNARAAVVASALLVNQAHLLNELLVAGSSDAALTPAPGVVACAGDLVQLAHHLDRVGLPVCRDEGEDFRF